MHPFLGVFFHWLGGLASGSFYVPYRQVRKWSWETYWLVGGVCSWIICPWFFAGVMTKDLLGVLCSQSPSTLWWTYFFGALWGFGGLTFGLTMRYLGMSLGMGVALGYCAAFGTLLPPILKTVASREEGVDRVLAEVERHREHLAAGREVERGFEQHVDPYLVADRLFSGVLHEHEEPPA